jgi:hypothetical protein
MANTYILIASQVLGSTTASVTFSSIPATYTDLLLKISARTNDATSVVNSILLRINGDTATNYSETRLSGNGSTASSSRTTSNTTMNINAGAAGANSTASTFSNTDIYIPNYLISDNKPVGYLGTGENNATLSLISHGAGLWRNTAAVSAISMTPTSGNIVSGSSFYLYGIKNS